MSTRICLIVLIAFTFSLPSFASQSHSPMAEAYYHYLMGALKEHVRNFSGAIDEYREALKYDSKSSEIFSRLAELYIETNRTDEAIRDARKAIEKNADNKEAHRMLGQIFLEKTYMAGSKQQDLQSAIGEFQEVRRIDPEDDSATLSLGQLYLQNNQPQSAVELLNKYLERNPDSSTALLALASAYQVMGRTEQAVSSLSGYLDLNPDNLNALLQITDLYEKKGDYAHALDFLKRACESDPDNPNLVRKYTDLLGKNQNFSEAIQILEGRVKAEPQRTDWSILLAKMLQKSGNQERAEAILTEQITKNPDDLDLMLSLVQVYEDGRKYVDAMRELEAMSTKLSSDPTMEEKERKANQALIFTHRGFTAQQMKDYEKAVEYYKKAREFVEPDDQNKIDFYIALNYRNEKKWDDAIETTNEIIQKDPNDTDSWELLSLIYEEKGDSDNSDKVIRHLIDTHPDSPTYYVLKAQRLQQREKYAESVDYLKEVVKKFSSSDEIFFLLGAASERLKKINDAEEYFKQAITLNPRNADALNYLGYMLIDKGVRLEESIEYVRRALEMDRDNGAYLDSLGWGYFKLNRLDQAEDNLRLALERLDDNAVVHDHIGDLYFKLGRFRDAVQHWELAIKSKSKDIDPDYIQKKIDDTKSRLQ